MATISSSRSDGQALPSSSSEASSVATFPADRNPTLDRNADRSERMLICTSNRSERSGRGSALRRRRE